LEKIIPANPLADYLSNKDEIDQAILDVLESGYYVLSNEVEKFESNFAEYLAVKYAIGVGNGTDAIEIALAALGITKKDVVITVANTAIATVSAIMNAGAEPVFADIDPQSFCMDPDSLKDCIQSSDKPIGAIIPVHLYGHPADMFSIIEIADEYGIRVIEDCAQAHGAMINNRKVSTFGDIGCFSFYPTKNLGAIGDGGIVVTDDETLARKIKMLRQYGWENRNNSLFLGRNSRMDEIQAAILNVKLKYLDKNNEKRRHIAFHYQEALKESNITLPKILTDQVYHVLHQYVVQSHNRDQLKEYLGKKGVLTQIHYPVPIHKQPVYSNNYSRKYHLPLTDHITTNILSLPIYPNLSIEALNYVCDSIIKFK